MIALEYLVIGHICSIALEQGNMPTFAVLRSLKSRHHQPLTSTDV